MHVPILLENITLTYAQEPFGQMVHSYIAIYTMLIVKNFGGKKLW